MTSSIKKLKQSPLGRHPVLFFRKALKRMGHQKRFFFDVPPASLQWNEQTDWNQRLVTWINSCNLDAQPYPWTRQFKQNFDETFLLERCIMGPLSERSLRGDVKLIWEFSRLQGVFLRTAQQLHTPLKANAENVQKWFKKNNQAHGYNWVNAMEVAIRATNLIAANTLSGENIRHSLGESDWLYWMWNHARTIEAKIEARIISSNHYLADLMGLAVIATHLEGDPQVDEWREFALSEFQTAILAQTFEDGGVYEASLPYHALVTEMALLVASLPGTELRPEFLNRLDKMCLVLADMMNVGGDVFCFGDDDGGRILPLDFISKEQGRSEILLLLARQLGFEPAPSPTHAIYSRSGWARFSKGPWTLAVEFGGVGFYGRGGHAHNDSLSFCLNYKGKPVLIDPGSYLYTPDPTARNHFRSTQVHNTIRIDERDHHEIFGNDISDMFCLTGPEEPAVILEDTDHSLSLRFSLPDQGAVLTRSFELDEDAVTITDSIEAAGQYTIDWFFHFAPGLNVKNKRGHVSVRATPSQTVEIHPPKDVKTHIISDDTSVFYGSCTASLRLVGRIEAATPVLREWKITGTEKR